MNQIAFFINGTCIHWDSVVITLASIGAICIFLSLYIKKTDDCFAAFSIIPVAVIMSLIFSRALYAYGYGEVYGFSFFSFLSNLGKYLLFKLLALCCPVGALTLQSAGFLEIQNLETLLSASGNSSGDGYVLLGVFIGCMASVLLTKYIGIHNQIPAVLDCMCIAGSAGIAAGRLSCFFNVSNRGKVIDSAFFSLWVQPVNNAVTGIVEQRLATFLIQSGVASILFLFLMLFERYCKQRKNGDVALLFSLIYCSSQFVLDSTRYDSLKLRSNGFISIVQIASMLVLIVCVAIVMRKLINVRGFKKSYILLCGLMIGLIISAAYMEYFVQRYSNRAGFAYGIMSISLCGVVAITLFAYIQQLRKRRIYRIKDGK